MGECRRRRHHLGAGHVDAGVGLLLDGDEDILDLIGRLGTVDRRVDDGVIHEQHVVLGAPMPALRISRELVVESVVGPERVHQRRLVVGRTPHPAIGHASPGRDGIALADQILARMGDAKEFMGKAAVSGIGRTGQYVLGGGVVQRVVELRDRARSVAERRVGGDVGNALAIDVDLAPVA